jgi:transcriptional regulator with PAS, ATPase and Fis domain
MSPTPYPYRVALQADKLRKTSIEGSWLQARIDRFTKRVLLRALRRYGNKSRAARALGITYRSFRYQWDRLIPKV